MRLNFYKNEKETTLNVDKINIFYGYSNSGKTTFAYQLQNALLGKDKLFSINGLSVIKDEKNVIYINSNESIIDHIKLSSKSYLKKLYYSKIRNYLDDHCDLINNINDSFFQINELLDSLSSEFNKKTTLAKLKMTFAIDDNEDMINDFMKVEFNSEEISASASKELLFILISLLSETEKETHIIIDDFDSFLDEQATINLLKKLESINGYVYLFSNKPNSIMHSLGNYRVFNVRHSGIFDFSNILFLIKKSLEDYISIENQTYEEYMLNYGYYENSGELEKIELSIKNNSIYNFGRILTSENFTITDTIKNNTISIIPNNDYEKRFLEYVESLINYD